MVEINLINPKFGCKCFDFNVYKIFDWNIYNYGAFTEPYTRFYIEISVEDTRYNDVYHINLGEFTPYEDDRYRKKGITEIRNLNTEFNQTSIYQILNILKQIENENIQKEQKAKYLKQEKKKQLFEKFKNIFSFKKETS